MDQQANLQPNYNASMIQIFEAHEAVRKRPAMYIGSVEEKGLHILLQCTVRSFIACYEMLNQPLRHVEVRLEQDGSATLIVSGLEAGTTFPEQGAQLLEREFRAFGHEMHLFVMNALSERLSVTIHDEAHNQWRTLLYEGGILRGDEQHTLAPNQQCDIWLRFWPDFTIFVPTRFNARLLHELLDVAVAGTGVTVTVIDSRQPRM